ncbi:aminotransferase class IV [Saccharopolyspora hordei]|uniref:Branched-subunit amino acid aminotransferase/4-amino-4-deoxychorismate lyase n=1 Tax=Saccharopolyspora hordei TaxID=1838 RepID=A0A853AFI8_9PSEU|nr:branched-subunit amino acid aminotransferase/4-amino-4-deoxychorismate lyase [Saccharopolyspora hordei]
MTHYAVHRNGKPATVEDLAPLAFGPYAHMTAMQVRDGRVRGLDLHLERVRTASLAMYGQALPDEQVRSCLRAAVDASPADHALMANVYENGDTLDVLVRTSPPKSGPAGPLSLMTVEHERVLPELKHVGDVVKTYYPRQAVARGFDDAAFVDRQGRFSEASIYNLAFWDGEAVVWPEGPMLVGTMMGVVRRQLDRLGAPQRTAEVRPADLPGLAGAVVLNSRTPGVAVHRIDDTPVPVAPDFVDLLHHAHAAEPPVAP